MDSKGIEEEINKKICELLGLGYLSDKLIIDVEVLIKAMWTINRKGIWRIYIQPHSIIADKVTSNMMMKRYDLIEGEEENTLKAAIRYVVGHMV